jgi:GNAT superfamily N-acetyltransferase
MIRQVLAFAVMAVLPHSTSLLPSFDIPGYQLRPGAGIDQAMLVKFLHLTYAEIYPGGDFPHLAQTVEQYFAPDMPLWWVETVVPNAQYASTSPHRTWPVGCLWLGNAIDQTNGRRHAHIFLLYVAPEHRRRGIGAALVRAAEGWARARGDQQIGLQVFQFNQPALHLYQGLGYQTQSLWMVKSLSTAFTFPPDPPVL